jgi:hypothetical protein
LPAASVMVASPRGDGAAAPQDAPLRETSPVLADEAHVHVGRGLADPARQASCMVASAPPTAMSVSAA